MSALAMKLRAVNRWFWRVNVKWAKLELALYLLVVGLAFALTGLAQAKEANDGLPTIALADMPKQAQDTVALIKAGGPFPYKRDGIAFSNREKILPKEKRGFYKEYTVKTPGAKNRGARRIVTGNNDKVFYYSDDHYASFKRVLEK